MIVASAQPGVTRPATAAPKTAGGVRTFPVYVDLANGVPGEMGGEEDTTCYGPVVWRAERTSRLAVALGIDSQQVELCGRVGAMLEQQVGALSAPLCVRGAARPPGTVRVVHCSDTHNMHGLVYMPGGDILVHTGDAVGNYGDRVRVLVLVRRVRM